MKIVLVLSNLHKFVSKLFKIFCCCLLAQLGRLSLSSKTSTRDLRSVTEGDFEEDFLNAHNKYRKRHGVQPLKLDKSLCKYAEEWAKHLASKNILEHRPESNYGENIYCLYTSDPSFRVNGNTPVDNWYEIPFFFGNMQSFISIGIHRYEEIKDHPFSREPSTLKSGHFTQVIWKSSESLGVGVAKSSQGSIYVVANYSPAGNFVGHYVQNCPPLKPTFYESVSDMATNVTETASDPKQKNGEIDVKNFANEALQVHNEYRKKHGVPQLVLNDEVSVYSCRWKENDLFLSSMTHDENNVPVIMHKTFCWQFNKCHILLKQIKNLKKLKKRYFS